VAKIGELDVLGGGEKLRSQVLYAAIGQDDLDDGVGEGQRFQCRYVVAGKHGSNRGDIFSGPFPRDVVQSSVCAIRRQSVGVVRRGAGAGFTEVAVAEGLHHQQKHQEGTILRKSLRWKAVVTGRFCLPL
jgi:hypothetical protein